MTALREEGRLQGREEGRLQGREEGRRQGREEGRRQGREEGRLQGREEGRLQGREALGMKYARSLRICELNMGPGAMYGELMNSTIMFYE